MSHRSNRFVFVSTRVVATEYGPRAGAMLRSLVSSAKADDPLAPVTVIVPSNYVGVSVRRALAREQLTSAGIGVAGIDLNDLVGDPATTGDPYVTVEATARGLVSARPRGPAPRTSPAGCRSFPRASRRCG